MNRINRFFHIMIFLILSFVVSDSLAGTSNCIISLSPHITEMVFQLGAGSRLIGRTDFCLYPEQARQVESIGGYLNIDFEKIIRLQPDLVLQFPNQENRRKLESLGLQVIDIPNETISEILTSITRLGDVLGLNTEARQIRSAIEDTLRLVQQMAGSIIKPVPAILVIGRTRGSLQNLYLAGGNTYLGELWKLAGGINAFTDSPMRYFPVNAEDLVKRSVDVILEFHPDWEMNPEVLKKEKEVWNLFNGLNAVKNNQIYLLTDRFFVVPGPRISQIAITFSEIIINLRYSRQ